MSDTGDIGSYKTVKSLGAGAFGSVISAVHTITGMECAIKRISKTHVLKLGMTTQVKKEITIMKFLKHPHIVSTFEVLASEKFIFICMELLSGGELGARILKKGPLSESKASRYTYQICDALQFCHNQNICHRDIKPQNILIHDESDSVKLVDFGFASEMEPLSTFEGNTESSKSFEMEGQELKRVDGVSGIPERKNNMKTIQTPRTKTMHTYCGTLQFMAPEIQSRSEYFGDKVDMWALGIVIYFMLIGRVPSQDRLHNLKPGGKPIFMTELLRKKYKRISDNVLDIPNSTIVINPDNRMSASDLMTMRWFGGVDISKPLIVEFKNSNRLIRTSSDVSEDDSSGDDDEDDGEEIHFRISDKFEYTGDILPYIKSVLVEHHWKVTIHNDSLIISQIDNGGRSPKLILNKYKDGIVLVFINKRSKFHKIFIKKDLEKILVPI